MTFYIMISTIAIRWQSLNPYGQWRPIMGHRLQLKYRNILKISKQIRIIVNASWYVNNDDLNVPSLETRLKDSARDTPIGGTS